HGGDCGRRTEIVIVPPFLLVLEDSITRTRTTTSTVAKMKIDVRTLVPAMFTEPLDESIIMPARKKGLLDLAINELREWTHERGLDGDGGDRRGDAVVARGFVRRQQFARRVLQPRAAGIPAVHATS